MSDWTACSLQYPPPHRRYVVKREHWSAIATPCYGMHEPWWVVRTLTGELEPIRIEKTDQWQTAPEGV
jgi:hypothetical protein